jgi:YidC/Oxa1 family membrane protein insertase
VTVFQVESALAVQSLKPRVDLIKARYGDDKDKVSKETSKLYEQAGVNPLAGRWCVSRGGLQGREGGRGLG